MTVTPRSDTLGRVPAPQSRCVLETWFTSWTYIYSDKNQQTGRGDRGLRRVLPCGLEHLPQAVNMLRDVKENSYNDALTGWISFLPLLIHESVSHSSAEMENGEWQGDIF